MMIFYLNEMVTILQEDKVRGLALIIYDDGVEEWVALDDLEIYKSGGIFNQRALLKREELRNRQYDQRDIARFERQFGSEERVRRIKMMACVVCGDSPCDNAHVKSRGAGGGKDDIVPLCRRHHQEQGNSGILSFQQHYGIDLEAEAKKVAEFLAGEGL